MERKWLKKKFGWLSRGPTRMGIRRRKVPTKIETLIVSPLELRFFLVQLSNNRAEAFKEI